MLHIKRLSQCTLEEAVTAWNTGFEGYYFDATMTVERFLERLVLEGLSPTLSIIAFQDEKPIGIIKNGIRLFNGMKIAWNGGTGVASAFRKKGIGKAMMEAALSIYQEEGVQLATLEAIRANQRAISLYEQMGYQMVDELEHLEWKGAYLHAQSASYPYLVEKTIPQQVSDLSFYKGLNPWQTQWQSAKDGEAIIVKDEQGLPIGYAYYRRSFHGHGKHEKTILFQCEAHPERNDAEDLIRFMIGQVLAFADDSVITIIPNLPVNQSKQTYSILKEIGFQTIVQQVFMVKELK
jgi:GNAT superfamily N-acetyltransferase